MEDVLEVYTRPYDAEYPQVCFDELSKQLVGETRHPLPMEPGQPERVEYEYVREGVANLFLFFEPLTGQRRIQGTKHRTRLDFAQCLRELVDVQYPQAKQIVLVCDNLNIHTLGSLYQALPAAEARRIVQKLEVHNTPKHGSWLNMAESEFAALVRQCLDRRIDNLPELDAEVQTWVAARNAAGARMYW